MQKAVEKMTKKEVVKSGFQYLFSNVFVNGKKLEEEYVTKETLII